MKHGSLLRRLWGAIVLGFTLLLAGPAVSMAASLPCDIYASGGTACVAAHSTTRALFASYDGPLYQVKRASDSQTKDIGLQTTGGYAKASDQDAFCAGTTCVITIIYDQTSNHNNLTIEPAGGNGGADNGVPADALPVTAGGVKVYGASFSGVMGYRNVATVGVARNGSPEGMYMVTSGTHFNSACCFDYGNAETSITDTGNGHMDAINFGNECWFSPCSGSGPWVQADLENGLFESGSGPSQDTANTGNTEPYVTAILKNDGQKTFTLKYGNAQSGALTTSYSGALPTNGYQPMHLEGSIVLGTGGDNSNGSIGSFFEGVMTAGVPSDAADNAVQANIVSVGYGGQTATAGTLAQDSTISLNATTPCCTTRYISQQSGETAQSGTVVTAVISSSSPASAQQDSTWILRAGLADTSCYSFESRDYPGEFMRHFDFHVYRQPMDGTEQFREDATFCAEPGKDGQGTSFSSYNYPTRYLRHYNNTLYISSDGGPNDFDAANLWTYDVSWLVTAPWAP
ncbi:alpha-L-arabinofuranosidase B [Trinickia dinghuensis]|uniref:Alpha-N-arabinofuranosidase n=1 Tax=Trinickia dinghuensis TaxID=2291023 RepID=A0A3D8JTV9_9BURK|nr:alpha-L-arabinofuranosidase B [Trinickia dinghuensis]RDU96155.1 alpha-N-arabinofuranosidase [Trinickia dinghuensis]